MLIAFHKPYGVLSQFTKEAPDHRTLAEFGFAKNVYPIGRLDWDSEGLLMMSDDPYWTDRLLNPRYGHPRTYHVQVERLATEEALAELRKGVLLQGEMTKPCQARLLDDPGYPERSVPIRFRKNVPTSWVEVTLTEGKNRQVRRMTAAVGFAALRLIRVAIGQYKLGDLQPGQKRELTPEDSKLLLS